MYFSDAHTVIENQRKVLKLTKTMIRKKLGLVWGLNRVPFLNFAYWNLCSILQTPYVKVTLLCNKKETLCCIQSFIRSK